MSHLADSPDILVPVFRAKAEVLVQAMPDVVTVKNVRVTAASQQGAFHCCGESGFAGSGKSREP